MEERRESARKLLEKAANAGVLDAAFALGSQFHDNVRLRHVARQGHLDAVITLCWRALFRQQAGGAACLPEEEKLELFQMLMSAHTAGHEGAHKVLSEFYLYEFGCSFEAKSYFNCLLSAHSKHEEGESTPMDATVFARLAWCYTFGIGTSPDPHVANELFEQVRLGYRYDGSLDTEEPDLWLYDSKHMFRGEISRAINVAKYMHRFMGCVESFLSNLSNESPESQFLLFLALSDKQLPLLAFIPDALLRDSSNQGFPPALHRSVDAVPSVDRIARIREAAEVGYVPAQVDLAKSATDPHEKSIWKTLVFAQESHYGFRADMTRQNRDAEMEDFSLRAIGQSSRHSSEITIQPAEIISEEEFPAFYEELRRCYREFVLPYKPVSDEALQGAVYNVVDSHRTLARMVSKWK